MQKFKSTSFNGQIQLGREELMDKALLDPKLSVARDYSQSVPFGVWQDVQHAVARAENFNLPCSEENIYLGLCVKKLIWLDKVSAFDAQCRKRRAKRGSLGPLLPIWNELEADYFGQVAKDSGAIPENLAGPYVGLDRTCVNGKDITVAFSPDDIKNLDRKFGVDIDIKKIRPLYNFGPAMYSFLNAEHFVLKPAKDCGFNCFYKTKASDNQAVFESRDGEVIATTSVSFVPPPAVLVVGADIDLVAKQTAVNYVYEGRDVCERPRAFWIVDAFPAGAEMNPYRDQTDSAYTRFTEKHSTKPTLKYKVQPLPPNSVLRIRLSASGHTGFADYAGNTVVFQWLYKAGS